MSAIKSTIIFTAGIGVGSLTTWLLMRRKCEERIQEEVDASRETFENFYGKIPGEEDSENKDKVTISGSEFSTENYTTQTPSSFDKPPIDEFGGVGVTQTIDGWRIRTRDPYVISPEEFDTLADFDTCSFTYYSDGIITDETDEIVDNAEQILGADYATHFGEYEDDSVFIRNENTKTDYEILYDMRRFADLKEPAPN